jgi:hypothetical protein
VFVHLKAQIADFISFVSDFELLQVKDEWFQVLNIIQGRPRALAVGLAFPIAALTVIVLIECSLGGEG